MNRTPRSARRRASRQLAANVPGLRASGPYSSNVRAGSFERSVSSGTEVCILYAISYCAMRVAISGSPNSSSSTWLSFRQVVDEPPPLGRVKPGGSERYSTGSPPRAELHALILASARSRCPTAGRPAADRSDCPLPCEIITTNAGRSLFSLPSPYASHEPMDGRPAIWKSGLEKRHRRIVIDRLRVHRLDEAEIVRHLAQYAASTR